MNTDAFKLGTVQHATIALTAKELAARKVVDAVAAQCRKYMESGELHLPTNYDVNGALKSAWLALQEVTDRDKRPALEVCTQASIANALLDMIVQGLHPMKKQCAFVVYGRKLICQREYFGSMAIAERVNADIDDWGSEVVYEGDEFEYELTNGKKTVVKHTQKLENIKPDRIIAAYASPINKKGEPIATEIMTIDQIHKAWAMSRVGMPLFSLKVST